jgi:plastocyanin
MIRTQLMNVAPQTQSQVAEQASDTVVIRNFNYAPKTITIKAGQSVTWTNEDAVAHTATSDDGTWDTGSVAKGESKSVTFANPGTYKYHCTPHPFMTAEVVVTQ